MYVAFFWITHLDQPSFPNSSGPQFFNLHFCLNMRFPFYFHIATFHKLLID